MKRKITRTAILSAAVASVLAADASFGDTFIKANNNDDLNLASSWTHGTEVPGADDIAVWDASVGATSTALGADLEWLGMRVVTGHTGNISFSGDTLTLGAGGFEQSVNVNFTINNQWALSADQTWAKTAGGGTFVWQGGGAALNGYTLYFGGQAGTFQFKSGFTGTGNLVAAHDDMRFEGGKASDATLTIVPGGIANLNAAPSGGGTRFAGLVTGGGTMSVSYTNANQNEVIGGLTIGSGHSIISQTTSGTRTTLLDFGSITRNAGATVLFRGTSLGSGGLAPLTLGTANVKIGGTVTLVGGAGTAGQTTIGILKGALGDASGTSGFGQGLVTYDSTYGVRLLDTTTEYTATIADGQTQLDNVRLVNSSGSPTTVTLTTDTTVNSLSINVDAATSAVTIDGAGALTVNSGVIFANSASPAAAGAEMTINTALDFNGTEGVVHFRTAGSSNGTGGALLRINGSIGNTGGNGVTFSGTAGVVELAGANVNTYTGTTYINGASLRLAKSVSNAAIVGDIVLNAGALQSTGNQIADTSDITINGGTFYQKGGATNSGSGASETYRDLYMNGGSYSDGASGTSSGTTNMRNAAVTGGTWTVTRGHKTNLSGSLDIGGGQIVVAAAQDAGRTTIMTVDGDMTISNTSFGEFIPILMNGGTATTTSGGQLALNGNLAFTGNALNNNTALINVTAPTNGGPAATVALNGVRNFTIGDGAAETDLALAPTVTDGASAGGINKLGLGTLALNGSNTYSGGTNIVAGKLTASSLGTGSVSVDAAGVLQIDAFTAIDDNAGLTIADGGGVILNFAADQFEIVGPLTLGGVTYIEGDFNASNNPTYFSGDGNLTATPEPASLSLLAIGAMGLLKRRRRA